MHSNNDGMDPSWRPNIDTSSSCSKTALCEFNERNRDYWESRCRESESEIRRLKEIVQIQGKAIKEIASQPLADEYEDVEGEEMDVYLMAEAYELFVFTARAAIAQVEKLAKPEGEK